MSVRLTVALVLTLSIVGCESDDARETVEIGENASSPWLTPDGSLVMPPVPSSGGGGTRRGDAGAGAGIDGGGYQDLDANTPVSPGLGDSGSPFACQLNTDCTIMNVGNCCGYYPRCANVTATFAPPSCVGQSGVCGFPIIDACECRLNVCVEVQNSL